MSSSQVTEKRTVISSSSKGGYDDIGDTSLAYKPNFGSRSSNIMNRSYASPLRSSTGGTTVIRSMEYGYGSSMGPGSFSKVSDSGVATVKNTREQEKKDMRDLNERFANYIEKVRFLEAQNRKLGGELDELRSKWGKETTNIKQMYEAELAEARKLIDDLSRDKANFEIKMNSAQEQLGDLQRQLEEANKYRQIDREQINKLNQQLADYESEINMLRRSIESLETERGRDKTTIQRLQQEVDKLRIDLNNETLAHLDAENRRQTLEEEMEFMKKVHEQELKELAALAYRDTTAENREFWKSELSQAIRDIQNEYDSKVDQLRGDMEGFYNLKIQEYRTGATKQNMEVTHVREENKKLTKQMADLRGRLADMEARNAQLEKQYQEMLRELESKDADHMMEVTQYKEEISKLRAEMEGILTELQTLMDMKLSLELEIAAYRKLLEGEENRKEWRPRAGPVVFRDAIRPSIALGNREREREKEVTTAEPAEKMESQRQEVSPSSQTDAASSITMSESSALSQEGDDDIRMDKVEVEEQVDGGGDTSAVGSSARDGVDDVDTEEESEREATSPGSPVVEHGVHVKDVVKSIEKKIVSPVSNDPKLTFETEPEKDNEGTTTASPQSHEVEDRMTTERSQEMKSSPVIEKMDVVEEPTVQSEVPAIATPETGKPILEDKSDNFEREKAESSLASIEEPISAEKHEHVSSSPVIEKIEIVEEPTVQSEPPVPSIVDALPQTVDKPEPPEEAKPEISATNTISKQEVLQEESKGVSSSPGIEKIDTDEEHDQQAPPLSTTVKVVTPTVVETDASDTTTYVSSVGTSNKQDTVLTHVEGQSHGTEEKPPDELKSPAVDEQSKATTDTSIEDKDHLEEAERPSGQTALDVEKVTTGIEQSSSILEVRSPLTDDRSSTRDSETIDNVPQQSHVPDKEDTSGGKESVDGNGVQTGTSGITDEEKVEVTQIDSDKQSAKEEAASNAESMVLIQASKGDTNDRDVKLTKEKSSSEGGLSDAEASIEITSKEITSPDSGHDEDKSALQQKESHSQEPKTGIENEPVPEQIGTLSTSEMAQLPDVDCDKTKDSVDSVSSVVDKDTVKIGAEKISDQIEVEPAIEEEKSDKENDKVNLEEKENEAGANEPGQSSDNEATKPNQKEDKKQDALKGTNEDGVSDPSRMTISINESEPAQVSVELGGQSQKEMSPDAKTSGADASDNALHSSTGSEDDSSKAVAADSSGSDMTPDRKLLGDETTDSHNQTKDTDALKANATEAKIGQPDDGTKNIFGELTVEAERLEDQSQIESDGQVEKPETLVSVAEESNTPKLISPVGQSKPAVSAIVPNDLPITNGSPDERGEKTTDSEHPTESTDAHVSNGHASPKQERDAPSTAEAKDTNDLPKPATHTAVETEVTETEDQPEEHPENGVSEPAEDDSQVSMKMMRGEVSAKTTYQKTSTGPIAISEVSPEGKFITLENTSSGPNRREVNLDGWCLKRCVDGQRDYCYNFRNFTLKPGKKVKILARGSASDAGLNDLVFRDEDTWGVGSQVNTALVNDKREDKASHVQKTLYN